MLSNQAVADSVKLYGPVYLDTNTWHPADENNVPTGLYIGNGNVLEPGDTTDIPEAVILVSLDTSNTGEFSETLTITGGELTESIPLSATVTKLLVFPPTPPGHYWRHLVQEGDRVDLLAHRYYGNADRVEPIFTGNPRLPFKNDLSDYVGETIFIPYEKRETKKAINTANKKSGLQKIIEARKKESQS